MNNPDDIPRVVFDCMIFLQATANQESAAAAALRLLDAKKIVLYVSPEILDEITDVLNRPKVRQKNPKITNASVAALSKRLSDKAISLTNAPRVFEHPRDPKDEPYINLAIAVDANYLVSRDNDLLDLMKCEKEEGREFQSRFRHLKIVDPMSFLNEIENRNKPGAPGTL